MARADSAGHIDEAAGVDQPPPLVANAEESKASLMRRMKDSLDALHRRMAALEQRADEQERRAKAEETLALAEEVVEVAPS